MATPRKDLQAEPFKVPEFIGNLIFPATPRTQVAGTFYFQEVQTDPSAQYDRNTAAIGEINKTTIAAKDSTFACKEIRGRVRMGYDQVKGFGGLDRAELVMSRMAKRAFFNKTETLAAKALLEPNAGVTPVNATVNTATVIEGQIPLIQDKAPGRVALVMSSKTFTGLKLLPDIRERMKNTGIILGAGGDARHVTAEQLAAIFGVDQILIGPNNIWYDAVEAGARNNCALVVLPDETKDPAEEVQLGRFFYFQWDEEAEQYLIESFHDDDNDAEVIDAKGLGDLKMLNPSLATIITLPDSNATGAIGPDGYILALDANLSEVWINPADYNKPADSTDSNKMLKIGTGRALSWVDAIGRAAFAPANQVLVVTDGEPGYADKDTLVWYNSIGASGTVLAMTADGKSYEWITPAEWDDPTSGAGAGKVLKKPASGTQLTWAPGTGVYVYAPSGYALVSNGTTAVYTAIASLTWKA
jgi:hypothetical protein